MPGVVHLVEGAPSFFGEGELAEEWVVRAHAAHPDRFDVDFPNAINGRQWKLKPRHCVGVLPVDATSSLRIAPKTSIENLFRMVEVAYSIDRIKFFPRDATLASIEDVFESLASVLASQIADRTRKGLLRGYRDETEPLQFVRGQINLAETIRLRMRHSPALDCTFQDLTSELADNHILFWTLSRLLRAPLARPEIRRQLRAAHQGLAGSVSEVEMSAADCVARAYDRLNGDYRPMHALCRFFLEQMGPGFKTGEREFLPFILNMPALFEGFVAKSLQAALPASLRVAPQHHVSLDAAGALNFHIDLVVFKRGSDQVAMVADTKYKLGEAPRVEDIQQAIAYATTMRTCDAVLLYPGVGGAPMVVGRAGEVRVWRATVNLDLLDSVPSSLATMAAAILK